jgi:hypothetical protein
MPEDRNPGGPVELLDDAFVIRFGIMRTDNLRDAVARCHRTLGFYGFSLYGENRLTPEEIAAFSKKPHRLMRKTRVVRLRRAGFQLERRGRFPHLTLRFPAEPSDQELEKLIAGLNSPSPTRILWSR